MCTCVLVLKALHHSDFVFSPVERLSLALSLAPFLPSLWKREAWLRKPERELGKGSCNTATVATPVTHSRDAICLPRGERSPAFQSLYPLKEFTLA